MEKEDLRLQLYYLNHYGRLVSLALVSTTRWCPSVRVRGWRLSGGHWERVCVCCDARSWEIWFLWEGICDLSLCWSGSKLQPSCSKPLKALTGNKQLLLWLQGAGQSLNDTPAHILMWTWSKSFFSLQPLYATVHSAALCCCSTPNRKCFEF